MEALTSTIPGLLQNVLRPAIGKALLDAARLLH